MTAARPLRRTGRLAGSMLMVALAAVALTGPAPAAARQRPLRYIVSTFSAHGADAALARLERSGTRPARRFHRVLDGFAASLTPSQAAGLRGDPAVRAVTADRVLRTSTVESDPTWGLDRLDQRPVVPDRSYSYATTGIGVTVFTIDTGVRVDHQEFGGRATSGYDFVDGDTDASDCDGHGTHVAGTVAGSTYGVAKAATVIAVRVLDCDGDGWLSDFVAGLQYVVDHRPAGPAVVNISAGGGADDDLDQAVAAVVKAGIPVVVAAGNDDDDACQSSPARAPSAITVAASTSTDARAWFSNYGSCVDVFAPGTNIKSAYSTSATATDTLSGTSMAAPHVVGAVARYLQAYPHASPAAVRVALLGDATTGALTDPAGSPNKLLFLHGGASGAPASIASVRSSRYRTISTTWTAPYGFGAPGVTGYRLSRAAGWPAVSGRPVTDVSATQRSYTLTNLRHGATYTLTVQALGSAGPGSPSSSTVSMPRGAVPGPRPHPVRRSAP